MTRALIWAALVAVAACAPVGPDTRPVYRDTTTPIASTTRFDADRFAGAWQAVARFGPADPGLRAGGCAVDRVFEPLTRDRWRVSNGCGEAAAVYRLTQPGRLAPTALQARQRSPIWVLWLAEDHEAMAIGAPDGRFGAVLSRDGMLSADRLEAARKVLEFNGYDLNQLYEVEE